MAPEIDYTPRIQNTEIKSDIKLASFGGIADN